MNDKTKARPQSAPAVAIRPVTGPAISAERVLQALRLHWKLFATTTLVITALVIAVTLTLKPRWTATATIRIDPSRSTQTELAPTVQGMPPDQAIVDTQIGLMTSRLVIADVVRELDLQNDAGLAPPSLGEKARIDAAINNVSSGVLAERRGTTYLVNLSAQADSSAMAARLANAVAHSYLTSSLAQRADSALEQSKTLSHQLEELGGEVREAEAKVAEYRGARGIVEDGSAGTVTDQQIAPLAGSLASAEAEAASAQARLAAARAQIAHGNLESVSIVANSPVVTQLRSQRAEIIRSKEENDAVYGPANPSTIALNQQLTAIDRQIRDEANRLVSALAATAQTATEAAARQRAQLSSLRAEQAGNARASVSAESLEREAEARRTVYNQLAQTAQEAAQRRQAAVPVGSIVDRANPPGAPSFPNKPLFASLGVLLGLLAGVLAVAGVEFTSKGLKRPEELEEVSGAGFVASVPSLSRRKLGRLGNNASPASYLLERPKSAYAEALRDIRSSLQLSSGGPAPVVIAVVSALPNEGKSSLAASLARVMALSGDSTLLIDADLRRPSLADLLALQPQVGLLEVLAGKTSLDDALVLDKPTGLNILPVLSSSFTTQDVFAGKPMATLIERCRSRYQHIIIDTPPLLAVADGRQLAAMADANLLAVRWNATARSAVQAAVSRLRRDDIEVWGSVFTIADLQSSAIGRTDPAHYSHLYIGYQE